MPFATTQCAIWRAYWDSKDAYGNDEVHYNPDPDWTGRCVYAPGHYHRTDTKDAVEEGRPYGDTVRFVVFLPKTLAIDIRHAALELYPDDDPVLWGHRFTVMGEPMSYPRANTPGDYSWCVEVGDDIG